MKRPLPLDSELRVTLSGLFGKITEHNACDVIDHVLVENDELRAYILELERTMDRMLGKGDED